MLASESILTVVTAHFGTHGKKFTYISRNWYRLIDKFKWVKFYSTDGLHTELLVRKNPKCQHYYIPVSGVIVCIVLRYEQITPNRVSYVRTFWHVPARST